MNVFLEGMRLDSVNDQQHHHGDQMNIQQQQQFMQGSPRHNTPTCEHPTSRTSEKPDTKWTHSRSSTTDSYCQMHKILSRPSDCWVDWAWLDQIWRNFFFLFRSKALGHITSKNLKNMMCMIWKRTSGKFEQILFNKFITTVRLFGITSMIVEFLFWIPTWTFSWRVWYSSVNEQQQHHWDQMNIQQQQQFMQGSPRHNTPTCEHPTSRTSEKPDTKWTHSRSSTTDSYCQMHKILSRPSDCWVDWAWLDQIWRIFFSYSGQKHWALLLAKTSKIWYVYDMKTHKR